MLEVNKPTWTEADVQALIATCRTWIGVPWRHQGRSRQGVDCVGIFACVALGLGRHIQIPKNYTHDPDPTVLLAHMHQYFDEVPVADMQPGDFLLMRFLDRNQRMSKRHIALKTNLGILHAAATYRKVTEHTLDDEWFNRIEQVFRMRRAT